MRLVFPAIFKPLSESEGYCVSFPDLKGCVTQGSSLAAAIEMATDAASGWVLDELEDGNPIPKSTSSMAYPLADGEFINLILLDIDSYAEKYGDKAIRKNCTIPAWMNTLAEKQSVNFSEVLQSALEQKLNINK